MNYMHKDGTHHGSLPGEDVHNAGGERPERGGGHVGDHCAHTQHRHLGAGAVNITINTTTSHPQRKKSFNTTVYFLTKAHNIETLQGYIF